MKERNLRKFGQSFLPQFQNNDNFIMACVGTPTSTKINK